MASKRPYAAPALPSRQQLETRLVENGADLATCKKDIEALEADIAKLQDALRVQQALLAKKQYAREDLELQRDSLEKRLQRFLLYAENRTAPIVDVDAPLEKKLRIVKPLSPVVSVITITESPPRREKKRKMSPLPPPPLPAPSNAPILPEVRPRTPTIANFPDQFWSTTEVAKLLSQPRMNMIADGCSRKMRCSSFHPNNPDLFSTFADDGTLMLWQYQPHFRDLKHVLQVPPSIFRHTGHACVEDFQWYPGNGNKIALGFQKPNADAGEICVVEWNQGFAKPPDRVWNRSSSLASKGVSCIDWLDEKHLVTGGPNHSVVVWKYTDAAASATNMKTLHADHRSEIRSLCVHPHSPSVFSGALDGLVIGYDLHHQSATTVLEKRQTNNIAKINAVLAHPNHPHLLMVSCVHSTQQTMLLHDLRIKTSSSLTSMPSMVWYKSTGDARAMSQYTTPRWSTAGMHVSCGST
ncbi:hypothetical protein SPRG_10321 [Saprolegnia parasitica CBS 223.65]|uniref:Uncharacterized protein n=1 Tax=Saprolegnia parasitica (strain CBS 223.65) TaxID=695850 RepID=A0A067C5S6_SAPPC|nr:hypothetical protein SPRG_10321 [Saprolegnia parasitica CBS 223.65]KDO24505.1 hypothetical protein SPRG_10321 [Saprolegnia parasitica CBS 223.65]|eukprot:XP_012204769.1 hypothetical protein SPRG_10321 [Saprolegnia parasitica CBS 223.65]